MDNTPTPTFELTSPDVLQFSPQSSVFNNGSIVSRVIERRSGAGVNWREIWRYRGLLYFLTWRDVKLRYKQTVLGAAWAILQPLMTMVIFTVLFGRLAGMQSKTGGVPYPIYVFVGLLPWTFFANAVTNSASSVIVSDNLISKVYFPRLIIPLASIGAGLVDLAISFGVLVVMMFFYHVGLTWQIVCVPVFLMGMLLSALGVGALLSALTVSYRDFKYVVPFMVQIWMFLTPIIYPTSMIPARWRWIQALNPMAGMIDGFRAGFLGRAVPWCSIGISLTVSAALFFMGSAYFRSVERRFADII